MSEENHESTPATPDATPGSAPDPQPTDDQTEAERAEALAAAVEETVEEKRSNTAVDGSVDYDASAIQVLEGLEAVRKRPGMYIGSTGERGLHHLVYEVVDNSVDEALAGYCDRIDVTLLADGGVRVVDNGRGIPVDIVESEGSPAVEVVLTVLHAGGKFGGGGYKVSGGLHGVGVSVVNALSTGSTSRSGARAPAGRSPTRYGVPDAPLAQGEATDETGTDDHFWADDDIFETTDYSFETLSTPVPRDGLPQQGPDASSLTRRAAGLDDASSDADETERDDRRPTVDSYRYDGGLVDYVKLPRRAQGAGVAPPSHRVRVRGHRRRHVASTSRCSGTRLTPSRVHTFANTINTHEGGTHEEGFRAALTTLVNKFAREQGHPQGEGRQPLRRRRPRGPDRDRQRQARASRSSRARPRPSSATPRRSRFVQKVVNDRLGEWFEKNPSEGKEIVRKAQSAGVARLAARKARDAARSRKGLLGGGSLPGKLADCQSTNPEECELFIVEGDSAGGPAKQGRDQQTQAILPIRGKILNVEKARIDRVLHNNEVQAIISALGTGIQATSSTSTGCAITRSS